MQRIAFTLTAVACVLVSLITVRRPAQAQTSQTDAECAKRFTDTSIAFEFCRHMGTNYLYVYNTGNYGIAAVGTDYVRLDYVGPNKTGPTIMIPFASIKRIEEVKLTTYKILQ